MVRNPNEVIALVADARREIGAGQRRDQLIARAGADWLEAEALARLGQLEKADALSQRALAVVERLQARGKLHADILMTRGGIALDTNRMRDAFGLFRRAHEVFNGLADTRGQAIALQNIGTIYSFAGDQRSVLRYYAQARDVHGDDPVLAQAAANNIGTAHRELNNYVKADAEFRRAIELARTLKSYVLEARALNNLASVALLRGRLDEAERVANRGLRVAGRGTATEWKPFLLGVKAQVALARGDTRQALELFDRTFSGIDLKTTPFYFRDFHESASKAYSRAGVLSLAFQHLAAFKRLDDEAREIRSSTNAALAAAQFDFSSQELRIAKLHKGQLARDINIARARQRQQLILLLGTFVLLIVSTAAFLWVRRSRNETRAANRELASTNTALDKALRAKSEFLATTSHEIRTPLNGILGMTQVLLGRRALEPGVRDQVRLIDSAGNTMKAIVDDILDMSQIEQGRVLVERAPVDLRALMQDVAGLWRSAAERKDLRFELDLTHAPERIEEDERKLRQIGFNLLSNAVKFTSAGTVRVAVTTEAVDGDEQLVVAVQDTGIGIAADQHEAIFEPFKQADGTTSRQFGGTGLGLAISAKLARALGGDITVSSALGEGSTFSLRLPLRRIAAPATEAVAGGQAASLEEATVGVVEPNPLLASMVEACLSDARGVILVDEPHEVPATVDAVILCGAVDDDAIAAARRAAPGAKLVAIGDVEAVGLDAVFEREMPPLRLPLLLDRLLGGSHEQAAPHREHAESLC